MPMQVATDLARARSTLKRRRIEKRSPGASRAHTAAHTGSVWPHNTSATRGAAHDRGDLVRPRRLLVLAAFRSWLDSCRGIGAVEQGMERQGFDLQLTRFNAGGWGATFYPTGMEHVGSGEGDVEEEWGRTIDDEGPCVLRVRLRYRRDLRGVRADGV